MTEIYLTISLSTHNGDDTPQNYVALHPRRQQFSLLTFGGPCIVIRSYNKSQRDALFLNFVSVENSACIGQIYCPSPGVLILYSQQ